MVLLHLRSENRLLYDPKTDYTVNPINVAHYDARVLGLDLSPFKTYEVQVKGIGFRALTETTFSQCGYCSVTISGIGHSRDCGFKPDCVGIFGVTPGSALSSTAITTRTGPSDERITVTFWDDTLTGPAGEQPLVRSGETDMGHYELLIQITEIEV